MDDSNLSLQELISTEILVEIQNSFLKKHGIVICIFNNAMDALLSFPRKVPALVEISDARQKLFHVFFDKKDFDLPGPVLLKQTFECYAESTICRSFLPVIFDEEQLGVALLLRFAKTIEVDRDDHLLQTLSMAQSRRISLKSIQDKDASLPIDEMKLVGQELVNIIHLFLEAGHARAHLSQQENQKREPNEKLPERAMGILFCAPNGQIVDAAFYADTLLGYQEPADLCGLNFLTDLITTDYDREKIRMLFKQPPSSKTTVALISREELVISIDVQVKLQRTSGGVIGFECHLSLSEQETIEPQPTQAVEEEHALEYDEKHLADLQAVYKTLQRQLARMVGPLEQKLTRLFQAEIENASTKKEVAEIEHLTKKLTLLNQQIACFVLSHIPEPAPLDVNKLIEKISRQLERLFPKSITIEKELDSALAAVHGDADLMVHAIGNLCKNAMEAMPNGGILKIKTRRMQDGGDQERVSIIISDTGHGLAEEIRHALFEPFHSTKKNIGAGLGLPAVYGIIKSHGGAISVKSEQAKGTTFSMFLPAFAQTDSEEEEAGIEDDVSAGRILIIDDELEIAEATAMALRRGGYTVFTCTSCEEAFKISDQIGMTMDLFILDNQLVGTTGAACAKKLISKNPKTPMLFYSGADDDPELMSFIKRTGAGWLKKPFSTQDLLALVNSLILKNNND